MGIGDILILGKNLQVKFCHFMHNSIALIFVRFAFISRELLFSPHKGDGKF